MYQNSKLFSLWEKSNSGKTETISNLIDLLSKIGRLREEQCEKTSKDKWCVVVFMDKNIGITTRGDDKKSISEDFAAIDNYSKKHNFDIDVYICAAHEKGQTVVFLEHEFKKENIYWIEKSRFSIGDGKLSEDFYSLENKNQAEGMLKLLMKILAL